MTLKRQLFIASLLMLLIPWAGLQFVLELDQALRQQALQQLQDQADRLAQTAGDLSLGLPVVAPHAPAIYVENLQTPINLDGYSDDWPGYDESEQLQPWQSTAAPDRPTDTISKPTMRWQAATDQRHLYLLIRLNNRQPVFFNPGAPEQPHDRLMLWLEPANAKLNPNAQTATWLIRTPAPGKVYATTINATSGDSDNKPDYRVSGYWHSVGNGWQLELELPKPPPEFEALSPLQIIEHISLNTLRALVQMYQPTPATLTANSNRLDMSILPKEGLVRHEDDSIWLMTTKPVFGGRTLIVEQSLDQLLTLSGSTLGSVIARSTLIIIGLTLVLLGYASWLSWRIARLQRAVSATIDQDGRIIGTLPGSGAKDELGQLQNHFAQMADRLHGYNRYLESFSKRLSHELKTPVAVVRSSLENLSHAETEDERSQYIGRAAKATERLRQILNGMSEAARLEQSFDHADKEDFDLAEVISQASAAYKALDPDHQFIYTGSESGINFVGSPELLVQMLDKLVDNARDFTPENGRIEIRLDQHPEHCQIEVFNEGSSLPTSSGVDIFEAFVSQREGKTEGHLGQGLLIVRLIADFFGGRVDAQNQRLNGIDGACFRVIIPKLPDKPRTEP